MTKLKFPISTLAVGILLSCTSQKFSITENPVCDAVLQPGEDGVVDSPFD